MNPCAGEIQAYLDAIADPSCFCQGDPADLWSIQRGPVRMGPICAVRDQCRLFRPPAYSSGPIRRWSAVGKPEEGCRAYVQWEREKADQAAEAREWLVTMDGETRVCNGRDAQYAAIHMWLTLRGEGRHIDKMVLFDRKYSVREV